MKYDIHNNEKRLCVYYWKLSDDSTFKNILILDEF